MSIKETIWEESYEIPEGAYIPEGTELVQYDKPDDSLTVYTASIEGPWMGSPPHAPVRSTEPIPDFNDTGCADFNLGASGDVYINVRNRYSSLSVPLTKVQARNFVRKLSEVLHD